MCSGLPGGPGAPLEESAPSAGMKGRALAGELTHTPQLERARATKCPHSIMEGPARCSRNLTQRRHTHFRWDNAQDRAA